MNETMKARREALSGLRDHFKRELEIALARWKTAERFPKGREMIRIGMLTIREHDPTVHTHYTSICVQGRQNARRIAQLDWLYRTSRINVRLVAGVHVLERFLPAQTMEELAPVKFVREGFASKLQGTDGEGLDALGLSKAADVIGCLLHNEVMYEVRR